MTKRFYLPQEQLERHLEQHFEYYRQTQDVLLRIFPANKTIYLNKDNVQCIFLLIEGSISVIYNGKALILHKNQVFGEYQPSLNIARRATEAITNTICKIIILPYDYIFNARRSINIGLLNVFNFKQNFLKYCAQKLFKQVQLSLNQMAEVEKGMALIVQGKFQIAQFKSKLNTDPLEATARTKQWQIEQKTLSEKEISVENVICKSDKGSILMCQFEDCNFLRKSFQQFEFMYAKARIKQKWNLKMLQEIDQRFMINYQNSMQKQENFVSKIVIGQEVSMHESETLRHYLKKGMNSQNQYLARAEKIRTEPCQPIKVVNDYKLIQYYKQEDLCRKRRQQQQKRRQSLPIYLHLSPVKGVGRPVQKATLEIPEEFKECKFKVRMFMKARKHLHAGFYEWQERRRIKSSFLNKTRIRPKCSKVLTFSQESDIIQ